MKRTIKRIASFAMALSILGTNTAVTKLFVPKYDNSIVASAFTQAKSTRIITPDTDITINTRKGPSTKYDKAETIRRGTFFEVSGYEDTDSGRWYKIKYYLESDTWKTQNTDRWVFGKYTTTIKSETDLKGSDNREKIYNYCKKEFGLNDAAISGILANIYYETRSTAFSPTSESKDKTAYGICQWKNGRKTVLHQYNDYKSLKSQLAFMYDELTYGDKYRSLLSTLQKNISNNEAGAKKAASEFCLIYEFDKDDITDIDSLSQDNQNSYYWRLDKAKEYFNEYNGNKQNYLYSGTLISNVYVRETPEKKNDNYVMINNNERLIKNKGESVKVLSVKDGWGKINEGWISLNYVKVDLSEYFYDAKNIQNIPAAEFVFKNQIMVGKATNGSKKNTFDPKEIVKRAELVTTIYNIAGKPQNVTYKYIFNDVPNGKWFTNPIIWAYDKKIVAGYKTDNMVGVFGVNDNITVEQVAQMLFKYAALCKYDTSFIRGESSYYTQSQWAKDSGAVDWAVHHHIITQSNSTRNVTLPATREQCADMIKNLMENIYKNK
ncbi:phage tail tip lysozyme [Ruminococcus albus]|uniref:phage tail tip lysozyme n=1 Tax=Ruminococcus albus TaxID=1264 RepID=UPI000466B5AF|nr:phage tail tip lysozyme [Ruminococcus albus]